MRLERCTPVTAEAVWTLTPCSEGLIHAVPLSRKLIYILKTS